MSTGIVGTLQSCSVAGMSFDVMADANLSLIRGVFSNEAVPTSGRNLRKMVKRVETFKNLAIACEPTEAEILKAYGENQQDVPLVIVLADGSMYTAPGWIEFENMETETGKGLVTMHPRTSWEAFTV